jgi:hypothetical protein
MTLHLSSFDFLIHEENVPLFFLLVWLHVVNHITNQRWIIKDQLYQLFCLLLLPYQERVVLYCSFIHEVSVQLANLPANRKQAETEEDLSIHLFFY